MFLNEVNFNLRMRITLSHKFSLRRPLNQIENYFVPKTSGNNRGVVIDEGWSLGGVSLYFKDVRVS